MKSPTLGRRAFMRQATAVAALIAAGVAAAPAASQEPKRVSVQSLVQPLDNPWVVNNVRFQKEVAEALGIDLTVVSDKGNDDSNVAAMRAMIAAQPDGILFDPISEAAGRQNARLLEDNRTIGVTQDRLVVPDMSQYKGEYLKAQVTQDNREWGYRTMENLSRAGARNVLVILPPHGILTVEQIWEGARTYLAEHPEMKVVEESWDSQSRENAIQVMQRFLVKYEPGKDFDGVVAIGSTMALGARFVLDQAGVGRKVRIVTADDDRDVVAALRSGGLVTTLGGHWMNGGFGLIVLYDILNGHPPRQKQPQFHLVQIDADTAQPYSERFLWGKTAPLTADEIRSLSLTYNRNADLPGFMAGLWQTWAKK